MQVQGKKWGRIEVAGGGEKQDRHFPTWSLDNPVRKLVENPKKYCVYVTRGQVVADLGSGPGYYTFPLAECVGPEGRVIAVDSDGDAVQALKSKAEKLGFRNIEAHVSSAHSLGFIRDKSIDFILANGLLCCVAPRNLTSAVGEMRRILKPGGHAYLSVTSDPWSYVDKEVWEKILGGFRVEQEGGGLFGISGRWALVSAK